MHIVEPKEITRNEPRDHHVIPRVYLRKFTDNGMIYSLNVKSPWPVQTRRTGVGGIAYAEDYYRIDHGLSGDLDPLHVEKVVNQKHENRIPELWDLLEKKQIEISINAKYEIVETMLHLKVRNWFLRDDFFNEAKLARLLETTADELMAGNDEEWEELASAIGWDVRAFSNAVLNLAKREIPKYKDSLHNAFLIDHERGGSLLRTHGIWGRVQAKWQVLETNVSAPFILSDNPGAATQNGQLFNMRIDGKFSFYFPLNYRQLLHVYVDESFVGFDQLRRVHYTSVDSSTVYKLNHDMALNARKHIYGYNEQSIVLAAQSLGVKVK